MEGVRLALHQLRTEKLKSAFSLLGVIIGVTFLLVVVSVVEGMDRYITEEFSQQIFGVNTITVRRTPSVQMSDDPELRRQWNRRPYMTFEDAEALRRSLTVPALVGVETSRTGALAGDNGRMAENIRISGISEEVLQIRSLEVELGRPFSPQEAQRGIPVMILGKSTAETLFPDGDAVGRKVRFQGFPYRVVGVLEEQGSLLGMSLDNRAMAPAQSPLQRSFNPFHRVGEIIIQAQAASDLRTAILDAEATLRIRHRLRPGDPNSFELETAEDSMAFWDRISRILFIALPGLVGISLVVGGIVIMNIMLVSVMERTREVGVRKALGARRRDILVQFIVESVTLSGAGAVLGVGVGLGLAWIVQAVSPLPAAVALRWIVLGVGLGMLVGIIAGVYPAARASRLDPVVALRHE
ncbi:MAG: ABC transporter permease [Gemmatimonadota bacterium]